MEYNKDARATELIKRFRAVVKHAEIVAFPKAKNSIFLPVNMEAWHPARKFLYKASLPYLYANDKGRSSIVYFMLSFFIFIMTFSTLVLAEKVAKAIPMSVDWFRFGFLLTFSFLSLYGILSFLRDSRYHVALRIMIFLVFGVICLVYGGSLFPINPPNTHVITSFDSYLKVLFLVFSAFSSVLIFLINTVLIVLLSYIQLLNFTETIQTPTADESIEKLLRIEIANVRANEQNWRLLDLSKNEITYLRLCSESNLNSSEKRTIPSLVVAALISLFLSIDGVRNFLTAPFTIAAITGPQSWLSNLLLIFVLSFIAIFSKTMVANFKNIAIQSLIVETCLIAEYAVEENKEHLIEKNTGLVGTLLKTIIQKMANLISAF
jgi:hypothetical protein